MLERVAATTERTARRRPKDRKQQIIVQARDLFVQRGYANVSMALIAERVGITAGALYRHFDNKQVLLEEVMRQSFAYGPITSERLESALDEALETFMDQPYLADLWTNEARHLPDGPRQELRRQLRGAAHTFVHLVRRKRPDLDEGQAELVAWGLLSVLAFLGSSSTRIPSPVRRPVVRAAALALPRATLQPSGRPMPRLLPQFSPVSTRERLLFSAVEQFAARGYSETAMASIGAAVDVTGPNLYSYFASKADLLRAVCERGTHAMWLNLDAALRSAETADEALEVLISGHVQISRNWAQVRMDLSGQPQLEEQARAAQREYVAEWVALLGTVVPDLDPRDARLRVLIAFKVMNDLNRTPHLSKLDTFPTNLGRLAMAVLVDA